MAGTNSLLYQLYIFSMLAAVVIVTMFTWPLILLLQQFRLTREWYYSNIFAIICQLFIGLTVEPKKKLFDLINQDLQKAAQSKREIRVLEIGPGTGHNFQFYKSPIKLTTIDLNSFLEKTANRLAIEYPLVKVVDSRIANAEKMSCFEDNSFDIVIGTLLMCCINDNKSALAEISRILKPNGRYYFLEGNKMQPNRPTILRVMQSIVAKFWITCEYGCKFLQNNFDEKLRASKMATPLHRIHRIPDNWLGHELHSGWATKAEINGNDFRNQ